MSVPSLLPGTRFPGRLVGAEAGRKRFLFACGNNVCLGPYRFDGRLVDVRPLTDPVLGFLGYFKTFLTTSECRHPKPFRKVDWVPLAGVPAPGLPSVARFTVSAPDFCLKDYCTDLEVVWDGSEYVPENGVGIPLRSGNLAFTITPVISGGVLTGFHVNFSGPCVPASSSLLPLTVSCTDPLTAGGAAPLGGIPSGCCNSLTDSGFSPTANLLGYTKPRYKGRLVGSRNGRKVFLIGECCVDEPCPITKTCCGCDPVPAVWAFPISGVAATGVGTCGTPGCGAWNADWTIEYGANGAGDCIWSVPNAENAGICTPGPPWTLNCDGSVWRLSSSSFAGGAVGYTLSVADWKCFGPNVMTKTADTYTVCTGFPSTVTLTAA